MAKIDTTHAIARKLIDGRKGNAKKEAARKARRASKTIARRAGEDRHINR